MKKEPLLPGLAKLLLIVLAAVLLFALPSALYSVLTLNWAKAQGVYASPEDGVWTHVYSWYCGVDRVLFLRSGPNALDGSDPHVWYVMYEVVARGEYEEPMTFEGAAKNVPCEVKQLQPGEAHRLVYGSGGRFYLHAKEGWVYVPEGRSPTMIGYWMKVLGLAGEGKQAEE